MDESLDLDLWLREGREGNIRVVTMYYSDALGAVFARGDAGDGSRVSGRGDSIEAALEDLGKKL